MIFDLLDHFSENPSSNLISYIITKFENNYFGNISHPIIREKYFSSKILNNMINKIFKIIYNEPDDDFKLELLESLNKTINEEVDKINKCNGLQKQICSFNPANIKAHIASLEEEITYSNSKKL